MGGRAQGSTGSAMVRPLVGALLALVAVTIAGLAIATAAEAAEPADVRAPVRALTVGEEFSCSVSADGLVHCWGGHGGGVLGDGAGVSRLTPNQVVLPAEAVTVEAGPDSTCALLVDTTVWCWGQTLLELPDGSFGSSHPTPTRVLGVDGVVSLAVANDVGCGLTGDGSMRCWGSSFPVRHELDDVVALAAGYDHLCAVRTDGTAECWGENRAGQIGDGTVGGTRPNPVDVSGLTDLAGIAAGRDHTCAWDRAGSTWCWGSNSEGQLGTGGFDNAPAPTSVEVPGPVASMSLGRSHSCAVGVDGTAWCWGSNESGELGDGTTTWRQRPTAVEGVGPIQHLAAGGDRFHNHSCAITSTGQPRCWGENRFGAIGDGTPTDRLLPVIPVGFDGRAVLGGLVSARGERIGDIQVDLFAATADGSRAGFLRSATTSDFERGHFEFVVEPGCHVVVTIAPDGLIFTSGTAYQEWFVCTDAGEIRRDLDAVLADVGLEATIPVRAFATVDEQQVAAPGVTVDLFSFRSGGRDQYLGSATTGPDGTASFEVDAGTYVVVFISPDGTVFTNNSRWLERGVTVDVGETGPTLEAELADLAGGARIQALVNQSGPGIRSVQVDLFQAGADGLRAGFIESRAAVPETSFPVRPGCYVVVFVASDGMTFTNGSPWSEQPVCVADGEAALVTATLADP